MGIRAAILLISTLFALCLTSYALDGAGGQLGACVNIGPGGGGWFRCVGFSPHEDKIFVGGDVSGIFESVDGGRSFQVCNVGLPSIFVQSIRFHPTDKSIVYLGTRGGVVKSIDGGKTWRLKRQGFSPIDPNLREQAAVSAISFAPGNPECLYAGLGYERGFGREHEKNVKLGCFYRSMDGGESWKEIQIDRNALDQSVMAIAPLAGVPGGILLLMEGGLYSSNDNGDSWSRIESLPLKGRVCTSMLLKPNDEKTIFLSYTRELPDGNETGIIKSQDSGATWKECHSLKEPKTPYPGGISNLKASPRNPDVLYAVYFRGSPGVLRSQDDGAKWAPFNVSRTKDNDVWCGWSDKATDFAVDSRDPARMAYVNNMEVYLTKDGGVNWSSISSEKAASAPGAPVAWKSQGHGLDILCVSCMAISPSNPKTLYIGYLDVQLWKSVDGGKTMFPLRNGLPFARGNEVGSIAVDPDRDGTLFVGTGGYERQKIYKTSDGGASFTLVGSKASGLEDKVLIKSLVIDPSSPASKRTIYAGLSSGNVDQKLALGIYKSLDDGATWSDISGNLPVESRSIVDIKLDPRNSQVIYIAGGLDKRFGFKTGYIAKSVDGGKSWKILLDDIRAQYLQIDPFNPDKIYASTIQLNSKNGKSLFWTSNDAGATWEGLGTEAFHVKGNGDWAALSNEWRSCALAVDTSKKGRLYIGFGGAFWMDSDLGQGTFSSDDFGKTWTQMPLVEAGMPRNNGRMLVDPQNPKRIYFMTTGNGLWRLGPAP